MWYLYDSLSRKKTKQYEQLFKKLLPHQDSIILNVVNVQQQTGANDCGLFALAFFYALFNNEDKMDIKYNEAEAVTDFPSQITKSSHRSIQNTHKLCTLCIAYIFIIIIIRLRRILWLSAPHQFNFK